MSEEDLAVIRAAYDAMNRRDLSGLCGLLDPRIEWQPSRQFPEPGPYRGFEGVERHFSGLWDDFEELRFDLEHFVRGNGVFVVIGRLRSRGRASGAEAGYRFGHVWRTRAGKVTRVEIYLHPDEALEAADVGGSA
jgi:ketosteroid isomerase-like protein